METTLWPRGSLNELIDALPKEGGGQVILAGPRGTRADGCGMMRSTTDDSGKSGQAHACGLIRWTSRVRSPSGGRNRVKSSSQSLATRRARRSFSPVRSFPATESVFYRRRAWPHSTAPVISRAFAGGRVKGRTKSPMAYHTFQTLTNRGGLPSLSSCPVRNPLVARRQAVDTPGSPSLAPPIVHRVLNAPGQPLDAATRTLMEPRFGYDFSRVRVHSDAQAAESAQAVNAAAYTVGSHVVLGSGGANPGEIAGRWLLAHELTHVVQQRDSSESPSQELRTSSPHETAELEADATAARVLSGGVIAKAASTTAAPTLQRLPFGISLPTGLRFMDATEEGIVRGVFGNSLSFSQILLSNATGISGRPFTTYVPSPVPGISGVTVINIGPSAYSRPGLDPGLLVHESTHSWQSQHHPSKAQFMVNSVASQALAAGAGGSAYCYKPGKSFGEYGAEQIAEQVQNGEAAIVSHVAGTTPGMPDLGNILSLAVPHWEKSSDPGVRC